MADLHIKVGGAWKAIDDASVKVSGAWKQVETIYVKVSGAWKQVWENFTVSLSGTSGTPVSFGQTTVTPTACLSGIRAQQDGTLRRFVNGTSTWTLYNSEWGTPSGGTPGNDYWIRATKQSGIDPNNVNDGFGTWLALTSTREWSHLQSSIGTAGPTVIKLEIATDAAGTDIVATGYYKIEATMEGTS